MLTKMIIASDEELRIMLRKAYIRGATECLRYKVTSSMQLAAFLFDDKGMELREEKVGEIIKYYEEG